jgi:hypothetical protein
MTHRYVLFWAGADFSANTFAAPFLPQALVFGRFLVLDAHPGVPRYGGPMWNGSLLQLERRLLPMRFTTRTLSFTWRALRSRRRRMRALAMI